MIFCFPLPYFPLSQQVLYFLLSTLVLTLYIDVVLSLSISIIVIITGLILGLQPANETRRYKVTPPFIGWAQNLESALLLLLVMMVIVVGVVKHILLLC